MLKRIISCLLLTFIILTALVGCKSEDEAPDGMYSATATGEPFVLYVPEGWTDNRESGISSAYYSLFDAVTVSARYYTPDASEAFSLDGFIDEARTAYTESYSDLKQISRGPSALGKEKATRVEYTFTRASDDAAQKDTMTVVQYYAYRSGDVIILSLYYRTAAFSDDYAEMFEKIRSNFAFCEKSRVGDTVTDKHTPEGMKRASFEHAEYRFYVPTSWVTDTKNKLCEAYYPESSRPNVTVTSFSPDVSVTVEEYFAECEDIYKKDIKGYKLISSAERRVAGARAVSYTYGATYGAAEYRIMQTVLVYNDMVYSITYTALAERFEAHLGDVGVMLDTFSFR